MFQIFSLALLWAATTSSHQIFPSTCSGQRVSILSQFCDKHAFFCSEAKRKMGSWARPLGLAFGGP